MAERMEVYKCDICGNIVEVVHPGGGQLVCCNEPMRLLIENSVDASKEKHVPVMEKSEKGITVKVGSIPHPMEEKHWIEFVELIVDSRIYRQYLSPGQAPEAFFEVTGDKVSAREYCSLHGLWKG